tara:strand:- start:308 stop:517 length:210 start_codon:yes stop_codon:yes gene_type:complete
MGQVIQDEERPTQMRAEQAGETEKDIEQMMWYIWQMIREMIEELKPWFYALLIVGVALAILSTAVGIQP